MYLMKNQEFMRFTLWFDVEKIGYTTSALVYINSEELWFDVEKIGYTTLKRLLWQTNCCGLM